VGRVAVLGGQPQVQGFALAGALVLVADSVEAAQAAWAGLPSDVTVVVLTPAAAAAVGAAALRPEPPFVVVMPT
jgi:vacuolar-type H+-ATPase subunit F/Vma7